jgi:hypothetical protein
MPDSQLFSDGVDRLLQAIRPHGRPRTSYPLTIDGSGSRQEPNESLQGWFRRLVNLHCTGDPKRTAIEDNIAVFVILKWESDRLTYANIQTIWSSIDLEDYYLDDNTTAEVVYLRLDFDYQTLGEPFSHPLAHIHLEGESTPRFALDGGNCGNIIVDYLEFLYRNYVPARWHDWARREWNLRYGREYAGRVDPFPIIMDAFRSNQIEILRDYANDLVRMKRLLRERKDSLFDHGLSGTDRELLEYPVAR